MAKRRTFTDKFKAKVVALAKAPGAKVSEVARKHGVRDGVLRRWIHLTEAGELAAATNGHGSGKRNGAGRGLKRGRKGVRSPEIAMQLRAEMARLEKQLESVRETLRYYS